MENDLTVKQVAELWQCSEEKVRQMEKAGKIKGYRIGRLLRFHPADIKVVTGVAPTFGDLELETMKAETLKDEAITANANQKRLKDEALRLRDLPESLTAREEAVVVVERDLEGRVATNNQRIEELRSKEDRLNAKEGAINRVIEKLKSFTEGCIEDGKTLVRWLKSIPEGDRKYTTVIDDTIQHLKLMEELELDIYNEGEAITPETVLGEDAELFDETEGE